MRASLTHPEAFPSATFRPADGANELAVAEAVGSGGTRPERVTRVLSSVYQTIAGEEAVPDLVRRVCSGGREWLLQRAAYRYQPNVDWFVAQCARCGQRYDLSMSLSDDNRKQPGTGFPVTEVQTSLGMRNFEVPNGAHEESLARRRSVRDPGRVLAALCGLSDSADQEAKQFTDNDLHAIDAAIEDAAPEVADSTSATCPNCGDKTDARLEPLRFAFPVEPDLLNEVHLLAGAYGWSEREILGLSSSRRGNYAALIARERKSGGRFGARART